MQQRDSMGYTVGVALVLCVVCSMCVSVSAVALKDRQDLNKVLDRQKNILDATGLAYAETGEPAGLLSRDQVESLFKRIDERIVNLETGEYDDSVSLEEYDERKAAKDINASVEIEAGEYTPGVKRREKLARVYFVRDDSGKIQQVVLPIYGKGLWSTLYGFLAVRSDLQTVQGLSFYEHAETPGLGGEVDNPSWKKQWEGRHLYGTEGAPEIGVFKGPAPSGSEFYVDGLSGATITARGVTNLVRYWVGDDGFKPFLENLKSEINEGTSAPKESVAEPATGAETNADADTVEEKSNGEE